MRLLIAPALLALLLAACGGSEEPTPDPVDIGVSFSGGIHQSLVFGPADDGLCGNWEPIQVTAKDASGDIVATQTFDTGEVVANAEDRVCSAGPLWLEDVPASDFYTLDVVAAKSGGQVERTATVKTVEDGVATAEFDLN